MKKLLTFIFVLSLSLNAWAQEGLQKVRIDDFSGGQNSFDLANVIDPTQGELVKNVALNRKGRLTKRKGQDLYNIDLSNVALTGLGTYYPDAATSYIMAASGTSIIRSSDNHASWESVNAGNSLTTGQDTEFVQANDLLFILNGSNRTANWDGSWYEAGVDSNASPPIATTAAWLGNYMFYAGDPTYPDWIYFSNNLDPRTMTSTDIVKVNTGDGQAIVKLEPFRITELIAYKEKSIYVLDIVGLFDDGGWTVQPISTVIGCVAPRSVVNVGNDHIFLSSAPIAVRTLVRSSFDKILMDKLSGPIQDIFDGTGDTIINETYIEDACAILFDDKYILAICTGSSTVNNTVVVYDFVTKSWYLIDGWYPAAWIIFDNDLYCIDANDGRVDKCFTGTSGDMTVGPTNTIAASEPTVGISFEYASRNIDFDNPENYKQLDALEVEFGASGNYDVDIYIELDDGGFQNVGTINLVGDAPTLPIVLPFTLGSDAVVREIFHLQQYGEFRQVKVKVVQDGLDETVDLHNAILFGDIKPWRRE